MTGIIVHLFGEPPAVEGAPEQARKDWRCWPHSPIVDETSRTVTCKRCKTLLDPIDVLLQVASEHARWVQLGEEQRLLAQQVGQLKEEEKRVRARTKSHSRKDADEAVAAERARHEEQRLHVLTRTDEIRRCLARIDHLMGAPRTSKRR